MLEKKSEARLLKLGDELTLCGVDDPITVSKPFTFPGLGGSSSAQGE
jgi:hypothetical protein